MSNREKALRGGVQPTRRVLLAILAASVVFLHIVSAIFSKTLSCLQFYPSWGYYWFIYPVFCRPNYEFESSLFTSQSAQCGQGTERFDSKRVGAQVGSEAHQEPSPQRGFFYWEVLWLVLCFPHLQQLERAFDSITPFSWTTRIGSTDEWCFCHPKKSHLDHLKPKAALWEDPGDLKVPQGWSWGKQWLCTQARTWWWVPVSCHGTDCILLLLSTWACCAALRRGVGESWVVMEQHMFPLTWASETGMVMLTGIACWATVFALPSVSNFTCEAWGLCK